MLANRFLAVCGVVAVSAISSSALAVHPSQQDGSMFLHLAYAADDVTSALWETIHKSKDVPGEEIRTCYWPLLTASMLLKEAIGGMNTLFFLSRLMRDWQDRIDVDSAVFRGSVVLGYSVDNVNKAIAGHASICTSPKYNEFIGQLHRVAADAKEDIEVLRAHMSPK